MIISASRRTDIPAFYSDWFMNRVRAGFCTVSNPFNAKQVSRVSLDPGDVDALVFWTRDPSPMVPHVRELEARGLPCFFLISLLGYPGEYEPHAPDRGRVTGAFRELAAQLGPERLAWRYDPIILSEATGPEFHGEFFSEIARELEGASSRCIVSVLDFYRGVRRAFRGIEESLRPWEEDRLMEGLSRLAPYLVQRGKERGFSLQSCAEERDLSGWGVLPGACIDAEWISVALGRSVLAGKDPNQRERCLCAQAKDIGAYNTCVFGCRYCYATKNETRARDAFRSHDPHAPALCGTPSR